MNNRDQNDQLQPTGSNEQGAVGGYDDAAGGFSDAGGVDTSTVPSGLSNAGGVQNKPTYGATGSDPSGSGLTGMPANDNADESSIGQVGSDTGGTSTNPSVMTGTSKSGPAGGLAGGGNLGDAVTHGGGDGL